MRILLSSHGASPYGAERVLLALARVLAAQGHEVLLEIPHEGPMLEEARLLSGIEIWVSRRARLPRSASEGVRFFASAPWAVLRLARMIRARNIDVVWANTIYNPIAAAAGRFVGVPVVWHLHERNFPGVAGRLASTVVRALATKVVGVSAFVVESYAHFPLSSKRMSVVLNAKFQKIDPRPLRHGTEFVIGCVGQLEPRKRPTDVVEVVAALPGVRALFVGDGKGRCWLERVVQEREVGDRVALVGLQKDMDQWYAQIDCLLIPSLDEAFSLVALEAMAAGRPVVAARSGALPEVLRDAALYFEPGDVKGAAELVECLRRNPALAEELRRRGLARAAELDARLWASEIAKCLEAVRLDHAA